MKWFCLFKNICSIVFLQKSYIQYLHNECTVTHSACCQKWHAPVCLVNVSVHWWVEPTVFRQKGRRSRRVVWRRWWAWLCTQEGPQQKLVWRPLSCWLTGHCCLRLTVPVGKRDAQTQQKWFYGLCLFVLFCPARMSEKVSLTKLVVLVWITSLMLTIWAWGFTRDPYLVHSISKWRDNGMLQLSCKHKAYST